jgi:hypothetical protein
MSTLRLSRTAGLGGKETELICLRTTAASPSQPDIRAAVNFDAVENAHPNVSFPPFLPFTRVQTVEALVGAAVRHTQLRPHQSVQ